MDMASSLEGYCRIKIVNAIGPIRGLIKADPKSGPHNQFAEKLVRSVDDFKGLRDLRRLVENGLSQEVVKAADLVRDSRYNFAHGADLSVPPMIDPSKARDNLNEIASRF